MTRLHLISRRVPVALAVLVACAAALQFALRASRGRTGLPESTTAVLQLALLIEAAAASVIAAAANGPFGESERATGRRLPWLRLATTAILVGAALAALGTGSAGAGVGLPGGGLGMLRDLAGLTGIGLVCATLVGGPFAWIGPTAYFAVAAYAVADRWRTPWTWPARPSHDAGAALCAALLFAAGLLAVTVLGARDRARD